MSSEVVSISMNFSSETARHFSANARITCGLETSRRPSGVLYALAQRRTAKARPSFPKTARMISIFGSFSKFTSSG
jgi:hypothetical protein